MLRTRRLAPLLAFGMLLPALALADAPQMYKWTDAQGTVHFSDQPPAQPAPDLTASDMPSFPAADPVKLAQQQAALLAEVAALQQLTQAQLAQQAQAAALAREQAELAAVQARQSAYYQPQPAEPLYVSSTFVPRVYRVNLYRQSGRPRDPHAPAPKPLTNRPPLSLLRGP